MFNKLFNNQIHVPKHSKLCYIYQCMDLLVSLFRFPSTSTLHPGALANPFDPVCLTCFNMFNPVQQKQRLVETS